MLDLLLETPLSEEQRDFAESSRICAFKLLDLMNDTLEFSALAAHQVALEESEFPLRGSLGAIVEEFALKAKQKGLPLLWDFDTRLPESVIGDELRVKQLLSKLLENAVKFTKQGHIEIVAVPAAVTESGVLLTVQVIDTGIGIEEQALETIFESFRQAECGIARSHTGMGLGLSVAQELGKLMDAKFGVQSKVGTGSTFSVSIPLALPAGRAHQLANQMMAHPLAAR